MSWEYFKCPMCLNTFPVAIETSSDIVFCSSACSQEYYDRLIVVSRVRCETCHKFFTKGQPGSFAHYCSDECFDNQHE